MDATSTLGATFWDIKYCREGSNTELLILEAPEKLAVTYSEFIDLKAERSQFLIETPALCRNPDIFRCVHTFCFIKAPKLKYGKSYCRGGLIHFFISIGTLNLTKY